MPPDTTVVVIDDHFGIRQSLQVILQSDGWQVRTHALAMDFLAAYAPGQQGCLIVDINMPGMSGLELQEELTRRHIAIPMILMTGQADVPLAVKAMRAGALDFLEKPFDDETLLASVRRAVAQGARSNALTTEMEEAAALLARLTSRERDVLNHLALGQSNKIIAHELGISSRTVEVHRANLQEKLKARSLADLVRTVRTAGLLA